MNKGEMMYNRNIRLLAVEWLPEYGKVFLHCGKCGDKEMHFHFATGGTYFHCDGCGLVVGTEMYVRPPLGGWYPKPVKVTIMESKERPDDNPYGVELTPLSDEKVKSLGQNEKEAKR